MTLSRIMLKNTIWSITMSLKFSSCQKNKFWELLVHIWWGNWSDDKWVSSCAGGTLVGDLGSCYCTWESEAHSHLDFYISCCVSGQFTVLEFQMCPSAYAHVQRTHSAFALYSDNNVCFLSRGDWKEIVGGRGFLWFVAAAWWSAMWVWECVVSPAPTLWPAFAVLGHWQLGVDWD